MDWKKEPAYLKLKTLKCLTELVELDKILKNVKLLKKD